jgi:hypothetical protein
MVLKSLATAVVIAALTGVAAAEVIEGGLQLPVTTSQASLERLIAGDAAAWSGAASSPIALQRTPPLYEGDPLDDGFRPEATVTAVRATGALMVRLRWADATRSEPAPPTKLPDAGEAAIYKTHSRDISGFADAACVMAPKLTGARELFPSLMMGERGEPVNLYYWNLGRGFERLEAAGRATTARTGEAFPGTARRTEEGWEVIFQLPDIPAHTPLSFALWDGERGQRDGLKFFSLWYEVSS